MGFPTSLVTVVSSTLDLTYPHRHIAYFQIFHGRGLGLPGTMARREACMGRDGF